MPVVSSERGQDPRSITLRLRGDIDAVTAPRLASVIEVAVASGITNVTLDCSEVDYVDSSALELLIAVDRTVRPLGGSLGIVGVHPSVMHVIELAGVLDVVPSLTVVRGEVETESERRERFRVPLWTQTVLLDEFPEDLSEARDYVAGLVSEIGFTPEDLFDLKVAFGEALANAVTHGAGPNGEVDVAVRIAGYPDCAQIEVSDHGVGYDGTIPPNFDPLAPRGRGVRFMHALVDRVDFVPSDSGGTLVRLVKMT